jgi:fibronectin-binding autotransporter adhesin
MNAIGNHTSGALRKRAFKSVGLPGRFRGIESLLYAAATLLVLTNIASAASPTNTWAANVTGNWSVAGDWSSGGVPSTSSTDTYLSFSASQNTTATNDLGTVELNELLLTGNGGSKSLTVTGTSSNGLNFVTSSASVLPTLVVNRTGTSSTAISIPFTVTNALTISTGATIAGLTISGAITNTGGITVNGSSGFTLQSVMSGVGGITYDLASGSVTTGTSNVASTYSGATTLSSGTLTVRNLANNGSSSAIGDGAAGNPASSLVLDGGTLLYNNTTNGTASTNRNYTLTTNGGGFGTAGTSTGTVTFSGNMTASGTSGSQTFTLSGTGTGLSGAGPAGVISGTINDGTGGNQTSLTKSGSGKWTLSGASANTFTGQTSVSLGELDLNKTAGVNAITGVGALNIASPDVLVNGGTLLWLANEQMANTVTVSLTSGAVNLNGKTETLGDFSNSGGTFTTGAGKLIGTGASVTWSGGTNTINDGGTVEDAHVVITGGTNEVQGGATGGVLQVDDGGTGLEMTGSTLTLDSDNTVAGKLLLGKTASTSSNVTTYASSTTSNISSGLSNTNPGVVDLNGGTSTFTVASGSTSSGVDLNVSALIQNGALNKAGAGTLALTNATGNTYAGGTTVSAGALRISNTSGSATGTGSTLSVARGATLEGKGISNSTGFAIGSTGSGTATVLVGQDTASDVNTTATMTLHGSSGTSTIANANLAFNLDSTTPGAGNELLVGGTAITFNTVGSINTTLTLNLQGGAVIAAYTPYILVAGTGSTTAGTTTSGQYTGLSTFVNSLGQNQIVTTGVNGGLNLAFSGGSGGYGSSYLFLVNTGGVDDIEVEVVPEPSTWALMLGGLTLLVFWQRHKRQRLP